MGRFNSEGEFKAKPSAMNASEWMQQAPQPIRSFSRNQVVRVRMGTGWEKGTVVQWTREGVSVWLGRSQKTVVVRDNRNVKTPEDPK